MHNENGAITHQASGIRYQTSGIMRKYTFVILVLILLLLLAAGPLAAYSVTRVAGAPVRVAVVPLPGERELVLIATPCNPFRSGSSSIWLASYRGNGMRLLTLHTSPERQAVLGSGWLQRRLLWLPTAPPCQR
jgi:hypothetical protein